MCKELWLLVNGCIDSLATISGDSYLCSIKDYVFSVLCVFSAFSVFTVLSVLRIFRFGGSFGIGVISLV